MVDRTRGARRTILVALVAGLVLAAACGGDNCEDGICTDESSARLLDIACGSGNEDGCSVSGDAERTSGITDDTVGFQLGQTGGTLAIRLDAFGTNNFFNGTLDMEVLAAATVEDNSTTLSANLTWGSCVGCPPDPAPFIGQITHEYTWVKVVTGQTGTVTPPTSLPPDAVLSITGRGIDIADLRTVVRSTEFGCSIARPGAPRR